jgi:anti-sigma factor RsiW
MSKRRIAGLSKCLLHPSECRRTKKLLYEYVEGELNEDTERKLEGHLGDCPACLQYVKSYRQIIELTHKHCLPEIPIPPALKQKLREFIEQNPDLK